MKRNNFIINMATRSGCQNLYLRSVSVNHCLHSITHSHTPPHSIPHTHTLTPSRSCTLTVVEHKARQHAADRSLVLRETRKTPSHTSCTSGIPRGLQVKVTQVFLFRGDLSEFDYFFFYIYNKHLDLRLHLNQRLHLKHIKSNLHL